MECFIMAISLSEKSLKNDVELIHLFTYFSNLKTIKRLKQKQKELIPVKYIDVENKVDSNLKIGVLQKYCKDFYKNVLFYLPLYEIYLLKLRFYKDLPSDECERLMGVEWSQYNCQKAIKNYKNKLIPWLHKCEIQGNIKPVSHTKNSLR